MSVKTSLTLRNRDLVLEGWLLQSGPTAAAPTDALITRPLGVGLKVELDTRCCSRGHRSGVEARDSLEGVEDVEGEETKPHKPLVLCVCRSPLVVLATRTNNFLSRGLQLVYPLNVA